MSTAVQVSGPPERQFCPLRGQHTTPPHWSRETHSLLQTRLRAVTLVLLIGFGLFSIRGMIFDDNYFRYVGLGMLVLFGMLYWKLQHCGSWSLVKLRTTEVLLVWLVALFHATRQFYYSTTFALEENRPYLLADLYVGATAMFMLITLYGMFIPNNWRRALLIVAPIACLPIGIALVLRTQYPVMAELYTAAPLSIATLLLVIAVLTATYGAHMVHTLRQEAYEARQLGQYRLRQKLGAGGMGEVYLAEHRLLKRPCALKLIKADKAADPKALARFEREVQATAQLTHWNTVEIFDYGRTEDGVFYYVMEYLPGLSLEELVVRHGPLPPERAIHFLRQVCAALTEAHALGLVHRDLKPSNIFAAQRGGVYDVAKLLDFGLVKPLFDVGMAVSQEGTVNGSPQYLSPEQARGKADPDARADIYSLGAVGVFLLTGKPPFNGDTALALLIAHASEAPPALTNAPPDLAAVLYRCLAKKPDERYANAAELEQALEQCAAASIWNPLTARQWWERTEAHAQATRLISPTAPTQEFLPSVLVTSQSV